MNHFIAKFVFKNPENSKVNLLHSKIESVGKDWVVFRLKDNSVHFRKFKTSKSMFKFLSSLVDEVYIAK